MLLKNVATAYLKLLLDWNVCLSFCSSKSKVHAAILISYRELIMMNALYSLYHI